MSDAYTPSDELHLWWLAQPAAPRYVGALHMARTLRGVSLHYGVEWLANGVALSEDLPLIDEEFLPRERDSAAGAVDDARPDRWGERVIRFIDKPPRLSLAQLLSTGRSCASSAGRWHALTAELDARPGCRTRVHWLGASFAP